MNGGRWRVVAVAQPREEKDVLEPAEPGAELEALLEDIRDWEGGCVDHLCGCSCSC